MASSGLQHSALELFVLSPCRPSKGDEDTVKINSQQLLFQGEHEKRSCCFLPRSQCRGRETKKKKKKATKRRHQEPRKYLRLRASSA